MVRENKMIAPTGGVVLGAHANLLRLLGLLLLTAAALKAHELLTIPVIQKGIWSARWLLIGQVELELALGIWFLSGWWKRSAWWAALGCFSLFCGLTLYKGITGSASCGCFGRVHVNPWVTLLAIDLPALIVLLLYPYGRKSPLERISPKLAQIWLVNIIMICYAGVVFGVLGAQSWRMAPIGYETTNVPGLFIKRSTIDVGRTAGGGSLPINFDLLNKSKAKLILGKITSDYEDYTFGISDAIMEPGGRGTLALTLNTNSLSYGRFRHHIDVQFINNDTKRKKTVILAVTGERE